MSMTPVIWTSIEALLDNGINLVAVYDKGANAKKSCGSWSKYQTEKNTKEELYSTMNKYGTSAVAMACGAVSGGLEVLDIDSKHKAGIEVRLLTLIQDFNPGLFSKLRVHKTPSGGRHIIYRVRDFEIPGGRKVAGRPATAEELLKNPNQKAIYFIETRGEKNLCMTPPSHGYEQLTDNEIPTLSKEERDLLIMLSESLNEVVRVAPRFKPTKTEAEIYDENPFEHYNRSCEPIELLEGFGWRYIKHNADYIYFSKPRENQNDKKISASFSYERRTFRIFTDQSQFEPGTSYLPATVLSVLKFGGDKSKTYHHLVEKGYGQLKKRFEQSIVKKAALSGGSIPANFSEDAKKVFEELKITIQESHPWGIFWEEDDEGKVSISREGIYQVSNGLGFRVYHDEIYQIRDCFIYGITEREWMDALKAYIVEEDARMHEDICNAYEAFMQRSGKFTLTRLQALETDQVLVDTRDTCNKFFLNGYLTITADSYSFSTYDQLEKLVFYRRVMQRNFIEGDGGLYVEYLRLAVGLDDHLKSIIGFYAHEYKDASTGYFVVLTESCKNPEDGGGSGKNIFCELIGQTTSYIGRAASQSKLDEKIFQAWNGHRVFGISDIPDGFDFAFFKELITGTGVLKKLFKDERIIPVEEMPKFIGQTNFSVICSDGGLKRRMILVEFTDFFTNAGGVDVHFKGKLFPMDWTDQDWAGYDRIIIESVQQYLKQGRKLKQKELSEDGWEKRFKLQWGPVAAGFVISNFEAMIENRGITNAAYKDLLISYYTDNDIPPTRRPSSHKVSGALAEYSLKHGWEVQTDKSIRVNPIEVAKGRLFVPIEPPF